MFEVMLPFWLQFALATPVQFYTGWDYYTGGFKSLRTYSRPVDLRRFPTAMWVTNDDDCWEVGAALCDVPHYRLVTPAQVRALTLRDATEMRADDMVQYESADRKSARRY